MHTLSLPRTYLKHHCIYFTAGTSIAGPLRLPDGLVSLGTGAFKGCIGITSVHLPEGIRFVCSLRFLLLSPLTCVVFLDSIS